MFEIFSLVTSTSASLATTAKSISAITPSSMASAIAANTLPSNLLPLKPTIN
jgi:hypothetical protein